MHIETTVTEILIAGDEIGIERANTPGHRASVAA
jgi:hypothetical protein